MALEAQPLDDLFVLRRRRVEVLSDYFSRVFALEPGLELLTSRLASLEISRTLLRAGVDRERVPYVVGQALRGVYLLDVTSTVLARAQAYGVRRLGSLDAIHLATALHLVSERAVTVTDFVVYDLRLAAAARGLGFSVVSPGAP